MEKNNQNKIFDFNKFPAKEGLVIFPISMSRISNSQSGEKYFEFINQLTRKVSKGVVGVTFLYTDNLYEKYNQSPEISTNRSLGLILSHKNQFLKNVRIKSTFAENAFDFVVWMQLILNSEDFDNKLSEVKKFYKNDKNFKGYVEEDIKNSKRKSNEDYINFILEETLLAYLILKEETKVPNLYVNGRDKWRMICYPGKPNKSMIYFFQKNIFNLKSGNPYQNCHYDLEEKRLYDFDNIDLSTFKF